MLNNTRSRDGCLCLVSSIKSEHAYPEISWDHWMAMRHNDIVQRRSCASFVFGSLDHKTGDGFIQLCVGIATIKIIATFRKSKTKTNVIRVKPKNILSVQQQQKESRVGFRDLSMLNSVQQISTKQTTSTGPSDFVQWHSTTSYANLFRSDKNSISIIFGCVWSRWRIWLFLDCWSNWAANGLSLISMKRKTSLRSTFIFIPTGRPASIWMHSAH